MSWPRTVPWLAIIASIVVWVRLPGWQVENGWWWLAVILAVDVLVGLAEVASLRRWSGFWGEKNPDGTPKF